MPPFDDGTAKSYFGEYFITYPTHQAFDYWNANSISLYDNAVTASQRANIKSLGTNKFTLAWTKSGSPGAGTATIYYLAFR